MNKQSVAKLFKDVQSAVSKHSPEILTGLGIAGMITTTVLAVRATPKALKLIDAKKQKIIKLNLCLNYFMKGEAQCRGLMN